MLVEVRNVENENDIKIVNVDDDWLEHNAFASNTALEVAFAYVNKRKHKDYRELTNHCRKMEIIQLSHDKTEILYTHIVRG